MGCSLLVPHCIGLIDRLRDRGPMSSDLPQPVFGSHDSRVSSLEGFVWGNLSKASCMVLSCFFSSKFGHRPGRWLRGSIEMAVSIPHLGDFRHKLSIRIPAINRRRASLVATSECICNPALKHASSEETHCRPSTRRHGILSVIIYTRSERRITSLCM